MKYFFRQIQAVNMYKHSHGLFKIYVRVYGPFESTYYLQMQTVNYTPALFHFPTLSLN